MHNVVPQLHSLLVPIDSLVSDPKNARLHSPVNIAAIEQSYREHGQRKPLVVQRATKIVLAGNGQLEAAKRLGWTEVAAVFVDDDDVQAKRFAIHDNRTGELAEWSFSALSEAFKLIEAAGSDVSTLGFDAFESDLFLASQFEPGAVDAGFRPDSPQDDTSDDVGTGYRQMSLSARMWSRVLPVLQKFREAKGLGPKVRDVEVMVRVVLAYGGVDDDDKTGKA